MIRFLDSIRYFLLRFRYLIIGLVVLGVAVLLLKRPVLAWRADSLLRTAQKHLESERWHYAKQAATASLQILPEVDAMRVLVLAQERSRDSKVVLNAVSLFRFSGATLEDRALALQVALNHNDLSVAKRMVASLSAEDRLDATMVYQLVRFHLRKRDYLGAQTLVADLPNAERTSELELLLAEGLAVSQNPDARSPLTVLINHLVENAERTVALRAARLLASLPNDRIAEDSIKQALARFDDDQALPPADRLLIDLFRIALDGTLRDEVVRKAISGYRTTELEALAVWLQRLAEHERVVEVTDTGVENGRLPPKVVECRIKALAALERFDQLDAELQEPWITIPRAILFSIRAEVCERQGAKSEAVMLWDRALGLAKSDRTRNRYYQISRIADRAGREDLAMKALSAAVLHPLGAPPEAHKLQRLMSWLYAEGDIEALLAVTRRLLQQDPSNPLLVNNFLYLKALGDAPSDEDLATLRDLVERYPEDPRFRGSLALALVRRGDGQGAIDALEVLDLDRMEFPEGEKAIYAAALSLLERHEEAELLVADLDWRKLSLVEGQVFKAYYPWESEPRRLPKD